MTDYLARTWDIFEGRVAAPIRRGSARVIGRLHALLRIQNRGSPTTVSAEALTKPEVPDGALGEQFAGERPVLRHNRNGSAVSTLIIVLLLLVVIGAVVYYGSHALFWWVP